MTDDAKSAAIAWCSCFLGSLWTGVGELTWRGPWHQFRGAANRLKRRSNTVHHRWDNICSSCSGLPHGSQLGWMEFWEQNYIQGSWSTCAATSVSICSRTCTTCTITTSHIVMSHLLIWQYVAKKCFAWPLKDGMPSWKPWRISASNAKPQTSKG